MTDDERELLLWLAEAVIALSIHGFVPDDDLAVIRGIADGIDGIDQEEAAA